MERAREMLSDGRLVQALESQTALVDDLERLLAILLDRKNLEALEDKIAQLEELQQEIDALADDEKELRDKTRGLREDSSNAQQRALEEGLEELIREQRELLADNERQGRSTGTL